MTPEKNYIFNMKNAYALILSIAPLAFLVIICIYHGGGPYEVNHIIEHNLTKLLFLCVSFGIWGWMAYDDLNRDKEKNIFRWMSLALAPQLVKTVIANDIETYVICLVIVWTVLWTHGKEEKWANIVKELLAIILTVIRPIYAILLLIDSSKYQRQKKVKRAAITLLFAMTAIVASIYLKNNNTLAIVDDMYLGAGLLEERRSVLMNCKVIAADIIQCTNRVNAAGEAYLVLAILGITLVLHLVFEESLSKEKEKAVSLVVLNIANLISLVIWGDVEKEYAFFLPFTAIMIIYLVDKLGKRSRRSIFIVMMIIAFLIPKSSIYEEKESCYYEACDSAQIQKSSLAMEYGHIKEYKEKEEET